MNDCATSPLWVYPGSHRFGLVCNRMWQRNDPRLSAFAAPVEFQARVGSGLLFNSLLVHGTGPAGPGRRASCDIRFLPLCGFLGTKVHMLDENPIQAIQAALDRNEGEFLCAPRRDNLAWLGMAGEPSGVPPLSPLNWAGYVTNRLNENDDRARSFLDRMVNSTVSGEPVSAFCRMWRSRDIDRPAVQGVRENLLGAAQVGG